jgi:hypothetical protein
MIRLDNGVEIRHEHLQGYGGPSTNIIRVVYKNKLLLRREQESDFEAGRLFEQLREDWSHRYQSVVEEQAAKSPAASQPCDFCGGDTINGGVSQHNKHWCYPCDRERKSSNPNPSPPRRG